MTEISNEHINKLGSKAEDLVTGFAGVITLVSFDLYGCVQMVLTPKVDKSGKTIDGRWFDVTRLKMKSKNALLSVPKYNSDLIIGNLGLKAKDTITGFSGIVSSVGFNLYGDAQFTLSQKINTAG